MNADMGEQKNDFYYDSCRVTECWDISDSFHLYLAVVLFPSWIKQNIIKRLVLG